MNKLLVKIYIPSIGQTYEMFLPVQTALHEVIPHIAGMLEQYSEGEYCSNHHEVLCEQTTGKILDINYSARELGLHNGSTLVLI